MVARLRFGIAGCSAKLFFAAQMWVGFSRGDLLLMWMWGSHDHTERSSHCLHTISEGKPPHLHIHLSNQTPSTHGRSKQPPRRRYATATTAAGGRNKARVVGNIAGRRGEGWGSQEEEGRAEEEKGRPCQRCIKRSIGHLCHDEPKVPPPPHSQGLSGGNTYLPMSVSPDELERIEFNFRHAHRALFYDWHGSLIRHIFFFVALRNQTANFPSLPMQTFGQITTGPLTFASEHGGNEFTVISDFLESLEETNGIFTLDGSPPVVNNTEKFFLTAADPSDGRLEDRLTEVINAKYEAGFLKPYNYVNGYARLQRAVCVEGSTSHPTERLPRCPSPLFPRDRKASSIPHMTR
ncbi:hypothetical protein BC938DRAFT_480646 [Jimgerdemannia flammicorona]|uniref:Uncharacterized protein n=1 Tax=Jimgerdemannia flammicorona TaxID=994334 RepID=A0A433QI29_9FUNG|nr:hypothetical protein BC938DRAFT_480646 [Jimgerdemannia flammicorona]